MSFSMLSRSHAPILRNVRNLSIPSAAGLKHQLDFPLDISEEVQHALQKNAPVVALESTLITHGMPPPHSTELPVACERILRDMNVTPATIAILDGRIKVGVSEAQLAQLASMGHEARQSKEAASRLWKVGRREVPAALVKGLNGGTTVSATMEVAHMAAIPVFATGGIGGVHRGAETSYDISSDLISLSDTPVAVVCAGSKSILDIGLTLEYLETHAVPVAAFKTDDWPAFYAAKSGFKAPMRIDSAAEAAQIIEMSERLGLPTSLLLGVPLPQEFHAAGEGIQQAVEQAVAESIENGVAKSGKAVTPWLLERVGQLTKGKAIINNMALIKNNVRVGGDIAKELASLREQLKSDKQFQPSAPLQKAQEEANADGATTVQAAPSTASTAVVGAVAVDVTMTPTAGHSPLLTTSPGRLRMSLGGVGSNIARAIRACGIDDILLLAPVARDGFAAVVKQGLQDSLLRTDGIVEEAGAKSTATVGYLLDGQGEMVGGVADFSIMDHADIKQVLARLGQADPKLVCFDGNLSIESMAALVQHCTKRSITTVFEPTSNVKALRFLRVLEKMSPSDADQPLDVITPNQHELQIMYEHVRGSESPCYELGEWFDGILVPADLLSMRLPEWVVKEGFAQMAIRLLACARCVVVKSGSRGVLVVQRVTGTDRVQQWKLRARERKSAVVVAPSASRPDESVAIQHFAAQAIDDKDVVSVTGAGDTLVGSIVACMSRGKALDDPAGLQDVIRLAQSAAVATLRSEEAVGNLDEVRAQLLA